MGPAVGTVVGDEHGHIAEDGHAVFDGIGPDIVPLAAEDVLHEFDMRYGAGQFPAVLSQGFPAVMADIFGPLRPAAAAEEVADSPEQGVVVEPVGVLFTESPERFPGNGQVRIMGHIPENLGLISCQAVPGRRLLPLGQEIVQRFLPQPAPVAQDFQGNEGFVAGKGRFRQIRRIAHEGRRQGQDLPDPLAGGFEEIDEAICRRSQDAVATGCRQGRRMQEDTGPLGPGLLPLEDDYFQGRQGQGQAAVHRRDRRHARMEGIGQFPVSQAVRIDTDRPQGRWIAVHGDDEEAIFGGLAEDIPSPFDDPGKGEDVAVGIEGDEAARL